MTPVIPSLQIKGKELIVKHKWAEATNYQLMILPNAVTDIFQLQNQDTIQQNYNVLEKKAFGDLDIKVIDLDTAQNYVINLYLKNNTNLVESKQVSGQAIYERKLKTVPAGQYLIEVVTDLNGNGRWDTGNYDAKTQPEPFFTKTLEDLRENWEVVAEISIKE